MGPLIIVSGASGSGKSTIVQRLLQEQTWPLRLSVSVTTRNPRPGERDGVHYHYWQVDDFLKARDAGRFLEWAEVVGRFYGTPVEEVTPYREKGVGVLLDIDVQGQAQVKKKCPDAVSIFIRTLDFQTLEQRLRSRHTESEDEIQKRLNNARIELARAGEYDHQVINDDLETALASMRAILGRLFV
jgi:guanylate kinase